MLKYAACTYKGLNRQTNEDRIMINNQVIEEGEIYGETDNCITAVVCDGVGGAPAGEIAAQIAASGLKDLDVPNTSAMTLSRQIHKVNRTILQEQNKDSSKTGMATTIAGLTLYSNNYLSFNLGDSHIYKILQNDIILCSSDHTLSGSSPNTLTCYLGGDGLHCYPSLKRGINDNTSHYLLCSDGVYKHVPERILVEILTSDESLLKKERAILQIALKNGSKDDVSIILICQCK